MLVRIVRGNTARFTARFYDVDGVEIAPVSVALIINYRDANGVRIDLAPIAMTQQGDGSWRAEWDTAISNPTRIYWSAKATSPAAVQDGYFDLTGNAANL